MRVELHFLVLMFYEKSTVTTQETVAHVMQNVIQQRYINTMFFSLKWF